MIREKSELNEDIRRSLEETQQLKEQHESEKACLMEAKDNEIQQQELVSTKFCFFFILTRKK